MSNINDITYQQIISEVLTWVKANCANVVDFNGMSSRVKNGTQYTFATAGTRHSYEELYCTITSTLSVETPSAQIDLDMNDFLIEIGLVDKLHLNISPSNIFSLINNMVAFCASKLTFIANRSSISTDAVVKYLIYNAEHDTSFLSPFIEESDLVIITKANTVDEFFSNLFPLLSDNIRIESCINSFSFS